MLCDVIEVMGASNEEANLVCRLPLCLMFSLLVSYFHGNWGVAGRANDSLHHSSPAAASPFPVSPSWMPTNRCDALLMSRQQVPVSILSASPRMSCYSVLAEPLRVKTLMKHRGSRIETLHASES